MNEFLKNIILNLIYSFIYFNKIHNFNGEKCDNFFSYFSVLFESLIKIWINIDLFICSLLKKCYYILHLTNHKNDDICIDLVFYICVFMVFYAIMVYNHKCYKN